MHRIDFSQPYPQPPPEASPSGGSWIHSMLTNALQSLTGDRTLQTRTLSALTPPSPHLTEVIDVLTKLNHPPPYPTHLIARAIALVSDPTKILSECTVTDEIARKFRENSTRLVTALQTNHAALPVTIKAFLQQLNSALAYQQGLWAPVIDRITALFVQCLRDATLKFVVQPLLQPLCPTHIPPLVIPPPPEPVEELDYVTESRRISQELERLAPTIIVNLVLSKDSFLRPYALRLVTYLMEGFIHTMHEEFLAWIARQPEDTSLIDAVSATLDSLRTISTEQGQFSNIQEATHHHIHHNKAFLQGYASLDDLLMTFGDCLIDRYAARHAWLIKFVLRRTHTLPKLFAFLQTSISIPVINTLLHDSLITLHQSQLFQASRAPAARPVAVEPFAAAVAIIEPSAAAAAAASAAPTTPTAAATESPTLPHHYAAIEASIQALLSNETDIYTAGLLKTPLTQGYLSLMQPNLLHKLHFTSMESVHKKLTAPPPPQVTRNPHPLLEQTILHFLGPYQGLYPFVHAKATDFERRIITNPPALMAFAVRVGILPFVKHHQQR